MTVITDYASLQVRVKEMLNRTDLNAHVDSFIQMACEDIDADVDHPRMNDGLVFMADSEVGVPIDYRRTIEMNQVGIGEVYYYPMNEFDDLCARTQGGRIYTIIGDNFQFAPQLLGAQIRLTYRRDVAALSDFNPTNWILAAHPGAYLYGALKHSALYLIEDDRLPLWNDMYQGAIDRINAKGVAWSTPQNTRLLKRKVV